MGAVGVRAHKQNCVLCVWRGWVPAVHADVWTCVGRVKMLCQTGETTGFVRTFKVSLITRRKDGWVAEWLGG